MDEMRGHDLVDLSDRALAALVTAEGNETAFRTLYRRHTPTLLAFVMRFLGGAEAEAEDVIQDMWMRAVKGLERFRWEASLRTWLTGIALNRAREVLRKQGRWVLDDGAGTDLPVPAADTVGRLDLEGALHALPTGYRIVLLLHDVEGFTHPEISRRLDIAVGTSRSQLFHARRAMRRLLGAGDSTGKADHDGT